MIKIKLALYLELSTYTFSRTSLKLGPSTTTKAWDLMGNGDSDSGLSNNEKSNPNKTHRECKLGTDVIWETDKIMKFPVVIVIIDNLHHSPPFSNDPS